MHRPSDNLTALLFSSPVRLGGTNFNVEAREQRPEGGSGLGLIWTLFKCLIYKQTNKTEDIKYLKLNKTHNQAHRDELGAGVYILYQNHSSD